MLQKGVTSYKVAKTITAKNSKINKFTKLISQKLFIILCKKLKKKKEMGKIFLITNLFCIAFDKFTRIHQRNVLNKSQIKGRFPAC